MQGGGGGGRVHFLHEQSTYRSSVMNATSKFSQGWEWLGAETIVPDLFVP